MQRSALSPLPALLTNNVKEKKNPRCYFVGKETIRLNKMCCRVCSFHRGQGRQFDAFPFEAPRCGLLLRQTYLPMWAFGSKQVTGTSGGTKGRARANNDSRAEGRR